jgi:NAD(P)-dependent dehydrogenase (short-subunit alcohol dehydrogenase family)
MSAGIDLAGKIAVISGGASGIGAATACRFVAAGAQVLIGDLDVARGEAVARDLGPGAGFQRLDVTVEQDWSAAMDVARARFGTWPSRGISNTRRSKAFDAPSRSTWRASSWAAGPPYGR